MPDEPEGIGLIDRDAGVPESVKGSVPSTPGPPGVAPVPVAPVAPARAPGALTLVAADDATRRVTAGTLSTLSAVVRTAHPEGTTGSLRIEVAYTSTYPGEGAEWPVKWLPPGKRAYTNFVRRQEHLPITVTPSTPLAISFEVQAPVGVRYGDRVELRLTATADGTTDHAKLLLSWEARQSVLAIKSARSYEREVADTLVARAEEKPDVLFSLLVPAALRGYVFAEGMSFEGVREMLKGIRKARGLVEGETTLQEVEPLLVPRITVEGFVEGAIVELVAGPFKGEKARVRRIDQAKEEITVELIEAVVPIPVTVRGDHVRMLERGGGTAGG